MKPKDLKMGEIILVRAIVEFHAITLDEDPVQQPINILENGEIDFDTISPLNSRQIPSKRGYTLRTFKKPNLAYYVGYTSRSIGNIHENLHGSIDEGDYQRYLDIKKTFKVARIRFDPRGKEQLALFEDISTNSLFILAKDPSFETMNRDGFETITTIWE